MTSVREIRQAIASGASSASDVCRAALERIGAANSSINAFHTICAERAIARAAELDARRSELSELPLFGIPVAVKDNICTSGVKTTACSRVLRDYVPPYDAGVVERLNAAGAVIVGKTNCDEFAMGSSTENSAFGVTRNPWALDRIPGGSSGGSTAAVAAGMVPLALGSDTGGSVRQPAALCGVTGLKPTYGRVSRYGLIAFASSLDQIGPIATTVEDAALLLSVVAGFDCRDATSFDTPAPTFADALRDGLRGLRVGVPRALLSDGVEPGVLSAFDAAIEVMRTEGASVHEIALPHSRYAIPTYYLVATAEASSNLARYDGVRYGFRAGGSDTLDSMYDRTRDEGLGPEVKRRIMLGTYVLSAGYYDAFYLKAQQVRTLIGRDYESAFANVDLVAMPTSPTAAFPLGERTTDPLQMYLADVFTVSANLTGLPAISVPCGFTRERLPVGLQLTGRAWEEATLVRAAHAYERASPWAAKQPPAPLT